MIAEEITEEHIKAIEAETCRSRTAWGIMPPKDLIAGVVTVMAEEGEGIDIDVVPIDFEETDCLNLCEDDNTGEAFVCSLPEGHEGPCQTESPSGATLSDSTYLEE